jgi:hypothetical protein
MPPPSRKLKRIWKPAGDRITQARLRREKRLPGVTVAVAAISPPARYFLSVGNDRQDFAERDTGIGRSPFGVDAARGQPARKR